MATTSTSAALFSVSSSETLPLTPELARKFRDMPASPTERVLAEKRVKLLYDKIVHDLFVCPTWSMVIINGEELRMNGNHSSTALCKAHETGDFPSGLSVHVDKYKSDSLEGTAQLFRQFDDRNSSRSGLDISGAFQGIYEPIKHVDRIAAWNAARGASWFLRRIEGAYAPVGDDVGKLFENRSLDPYIEFVASLWSNKIPEMKRDPVLAAMYGTLEASSEKARKFWFEVARGSSEEGGSANDMIAGQLSKDKNEKNSDKKLKPLPLYCICIKAWNCYVDGNAPRGAFTHPKGKPVPEIAS